jgi:hypothetical protein
MTLTSQRLLTSFNLERISPDDPPPFIWAASRSSHGTAEFGKKSVLGFDLAQ